MVFFDAGNTLFREYPLRWEIYANVANEFGLSASVEAMRAAMIEAQENLPARIDGHFRYSEGWFAAYIPRVFGKFGVQEKQIPAIREKLFAAFRQPGTFRLFPETKEVLNQFRDQGVRMAVISNWSPRLPGIFDGLGLTSYMEFVFASSIEELEKPDPALFERALKKAKLRADDALHVGDSWEKDVQGANSVGMLGVLLDRDGTVKSANETFPTIRSLRELAAIVEKGIAK